MNLSNQFQLIEEKESYTMAWMAVFANSSQEEKEKKFAILFQFPFQVQTN